MVGTLLAPVTCMGRPLRRQMPGQLYLFTTRCHQARFFLRPDRAVNDLVLEWLARAQQAFPQVRLHAVCVLSNHLHLVVRDERGELAAWASYWLGNLARAVNRLRGRSGTFFERRYSAEPILDNEALCERMVYVVTNPVKAGLCRKAREWPGVVLYAEDPQPREIPVEWNDRELERRRPGARGTEASRVEGCLRIDPFPGEGPGARVRRAVEAQEQALAEERRRAGGEVLKRAAILAQSWSAAPRKPKRSPRPLCHTTDPGLRRSFREAFGEFTARFREASKRLRQGSRALFPDWSHPPGRPLVRPALARAG